MDSESSVTDVAIFAYWMYLTSDLTSDVIFGCDFKSSFQKYNFRYILSLLNASLLMHQLFSAGNFSKSFIIKVDDRDLLCARRTCQWWVILEFDVVLDVILDRLFTNTIVIMFRAFWSSALPTWLTLACWTVLCLWSFNQRLHSSSNVTSRCDYKSSVPEHRCHHVLCLLNTSLFRWQLVQS